MHASTTSKIEGLKLEMKSTFGEILFASVLSSATAAVAAVAGFVGGMLLHGWLYGRGMRVASFYVGYGMMLLMPVSVFILVFWKTLHFGAPDSLPSSR